MKIFFSFNHPAPYKVALFNGLAQYFDLHVIFERQKAKNRHPLFYKNPDYLFTLHPIKGIPIGKENILSWGIKKHLKKNKYDLIVINGYSTLAEMIALRYLKKKKIPYVFYINGGVVRSKENKLIRAVKHYFLSGAKYYLSPSDEADRYLLHYGIKKKDIRHFPYATIYEKEIAQTKLTSIEKQYRRKQHGITGEQVFISVGQFIDRKNNMLLLQIWTKMPKTRTLLLVGEGPDKKKYLDFIAAHHLDNVIILDFQKRSKVLELLYLSDYAIFLSKEDIYGHVINEALSQGLGVIASDKMVAAVTLLKNDVNGYIINIEKPEEIIKTINKIATKDFFNGAINTAKQNTIELMVKRHVEIFKGDLKWKLFI